MTSKRQANTMTVAFYDAKVSESTNWQTMFAASGRKHGVVFFFFRDRNSRDLLLDRATFVAYVYDLAINGKVKLCFAGTDCDGYRWYREQTIPAVPTIINKEIETAYQWADGPMSYSLETIDVECRL